MKEKNWMRTVFHAYRTIDRVLKAIDRNVVSQSVSSHKICGFDETAQMMDDVLEQIHRKRKLCVLKYLIEQSVKNIKKDRAKVLVLKFFDCLSEEEICFLTNMSSRTVHRKISDGLKECYVFFALNGCDVNALEKCFANEKFLMGIFSRVSSKQKKNIQNLNSKFTMNSNSSFDGYFLHG